MQPFSSCSVSVESVWPKILNYPSKLLLIYSGVILQLLEFKTNKPVKGSREI